MLVILLIGLLHGVAALRGVYQLLHGVNAFLSGGKGKIVLPGEKVTRQAVMEGIVDDGLGGGYIFSGFPTDAFVQSHGADADMAAVQQIQVVPALGILFGDNQVRGQLPGQGQIIQPAKKCAAILLPQGADDFDAGLVDIIALLAGLVVKARF